MSIDFFVQVALVGLLATHCHMVAGLWLKSIGLPRLDLARAMADFTYGDSFAAAPPYWAGQILIYLNGIVFALIYAALAAAYLPGPPVIRGMAFGLVLFALSGLLFVPIFLREGFFMSRIHRQAWISSLIIHAVWGLIVGWLSPVLGR